MRRFELHGNWLQLGTFGLIAVHRGTLQHVGLHGSTFWYIGTFLVHKYILLQYAFQYRCVGQV